MNILTGVKRKFEEWFTSPRQPPKKKRKFGSLPQVSNSSETGRVVQIIDNGRGEDNTVVSSPPPPKKSRRERTKRKKKNSYMKRLGSYFYPSRKPHQIKREIHGKSSEEIKSLIINELRSSNSRLMSKMLPNGSEIMKRENFTISYGLGHFEHQKGGEYVHIFTKSRDEFLLGYNAHNYYDEDFEKSKLTFAFDVQISKITDDQIFLLHVLYPDQNCVFKVILNNVYKHWKYQLEEIQKKAVDEDEDDDREEEEEEDKEEEEEEEIIEEEEEEEEKIKKKKKRKKSKKSVEEENRILFQEKVKDQELTCRKFLKMKLKIRSGMISMFCDGREIVKKRDLFSKGRQSVGPVRLFFGVRRSTVTLRKFVITPRFRDVE